MSLDEIPDSVEGLLRLSEEIIGENNQEIKNSNRIELPVISLTNDEDESPARNENESTVPTYQSSGFGNDDVVFMGFPEDILGNPTVSCRRTLTEIIDLCSPEPTRPVTRRRNYADDIPIPTPIMTRTRIRNRNESNINNQIIARCPICLESAVGKNPVSTVCGHVYCSDCLSEALKSCKKCPVCKQKLTNKSVHVVFL